MMLRTRRLFCVLVLAVPASCAGPPDRVSSASVSADPSESSPPSRVIAHALRLKPGEDVRPALDAFVRARSMRAAIASGAVGSLTHVNLRLAGADQNTSRSGKFEIVSLSGTLSPGGSHLHMSVADEQGRTLGGHVMEGCRVFTTLEIVILELPDLAFDRTPDPQTGYRELRISPAAGR